jgi:hypothetical protein
MIPCKNKILIYSGESGKITKDSILQVGISSYITGLNGKDWFFGTDEGKLGFGSGKEILSVSEKTDNSAITAIAKFDDKTVAAISKNGVVAIVGTDKKIRDTLNIFRNLKITKFAPFKIFTNGDNVIVADNKQGLWYLVFDGKKIKFNENQKDFPIDWAGIFRTENERKNIPDNESYLSMADLNNDGIMELLVSGTNGIYAFDDKGNLFQNYPKLLDRAEWWIRNSVLATPVAVSTKTNEKYVFFTTTTGNNKSYYQAKVDSVLNGTVYFYDTNNKLDSISGYSKEEIDTLLNISDSIFFPYYAPGGLIDMRSENKTRSSDFTISVGYPLSQGVVIDDIDGNDTLDLIAICDNGMLYCYKLLSNFDSKQTNMVGMNAQRTFSVKNSDNPKIEESNKIEYFYSYPNPVKIPKNSNTSVIFRYKLGNTASSATLSIYTMQGQKVFEENNLLLSKGVNEFTLRDLSRFGSAVYRCRLSAKINGQETVLFWKMAVLR